MGRVSHPERKLAICCSRGSPRGLRSVLRLLGHCCCGLWISSVRSPEGDELRREMTCALPFGASSWTHHRTPATAPNAQTFRICLGLLKIKDILHPAGKRSRRAAVRVRHSLPPIHLIFVAQALEQKSRFGLGAGRSRGTPSYVDSCADTCRPSSRTGGAVSESEYLAANSHRPRGLWVRFAAPAHRIGQ